MAYRFKLDESVRKSFRRIAREQIDFALGELSQDAAPAKAVHESRKALKRLRALIGSCAPALGAKTARRHHVALRDIGRQLSSRRDADVLAETVAKLEAHFGPDGVTALCPLRAALQSRLPAAADLLDANARDSIKAKLVLERVRLGKVRFKGRGAKPVLEGIEASYRRGRKALKAAYKMPSDNRFHELRKAVQLHWRQMALLSRAWPDEFAARVAAARELSQLLGDDHDLAMLKKATGMLSDADCKAIGKLCLQRQNELRDDVQLRARRLFAERPADFGRRISEIWKTGRRIKPEAASPEVLPDSRIKTPNDRAAAAGSQPQLAAKTPVKSPSQRRA